MNYYKVIARNGLKIRRLPTTGDVVLDAMPNGMRVQRLDQVLWNGDWYRISAEFSDRYKVTGYAHRNFLEPVSAALPAQPSAAPSTLAATPPPTPSAPSLPPQPRAADAFTVIASELNLRERPIDGKVIMRLPNATAVTKIGEAIPSGWWKVSAKAGGLIEEGFVSSKYLAPIHPEPVRASNLSILTNITEAIGRVQKFVGDYADALNEQLLVKLNEVMTKYKINDNPLRFAHFMAQLAHESAQFTRLTENLNYSADGLMKYFARHFRDAAEAQAYERQAERIANRVYANRMGNGDEASGDGWKYRGRGFIQLTGRENYRRIGNRLGLDLEDNPDLVSSDPAIALMVAADYWDLNKINAAADRDDVDAVTRLVNGGYNGLAHRKELLARAKSIWGI